MFETARVGPFLGFLSAQRARVSNGHDPCLAIARACSNAMGKTVRHALTARMLNSLFTNKQEQHALEAPLETTREG